MKQLLISFIAFLAIMTLNAQENEGINYQAIARLADGSILSNQSIQIEVNIENKEQTLYHENHFVETDDFGNFNLSIGNGIPVQGNFSEIDWSDNSIGYSLIFKTETTEFQIPYKQFSAVPVALYGKDEDADPRNEFQSLSLDGNVLKISDGNEVDLSSYRMMDSPFERSGTVVRQVADYSSDDFVFGSPSLEYDGNIDHQKRMLFDKSSGSFRTGTDNTGSWDQVNMGSNSFASGKNSTASGNASFAAGFENLAEGNNSVAVGTSNSATGLSSMALGVNSNASGLRGVAIGSQAQATNERTVALGRLATASGELSVAVGADSEASGKSSLAIGKDSKAPSFREVAVGSFPENYTPSDTENFNQADRAFSVGNGTSDANRSNAMTILKNGDTGLGTTNPNNKLDVVGSNSTNVISSSTTYEGFLDVRAIEGTSIPETGYGIGVSGDGGYMGMRANNPSSAYSGSSYALFATSSGTAGTRYGVRATATNSGGTNAYGVYGSASGATNNWGGYFVGRGYFSDNLGIGITNPANDFQVHDETSSGALFTTNATGSTALNGLGIGYSTSSAFLINHENSPLYFGTNSLATSALDAQGNFGLGTLTPSAELHVHDSSNSNALYTTSSSGTTSSDGLYVGLSGSNGYIWNWEDQDLYLGTNGSTDLTIEDGGEVGIGTTSPNADLHLHDATVSNTRFTTSASGTGTGDGLYVGLTTTAAYIWNYEANNLNFGTSGSTRMAISGSGNVGIGTTVPSSKFHIASGSDASLSNNGFVQLGNSTGVNVILDNNEIMARSNGETSTLYIQNDGGLTYIGEEASAQCVRIRGGCDITEGVNTVDEYVEPGEIVVIDSENPGYVKKSTTEYDRKVIGVISGANGINPGMSLEQEGVLEGDFPIAMVGQVYVKVIGKVEAGDLITTSNTSGYGMAVDDFSQAPGSVIGKALTSNEDEKGFVLVYVNLQ